MSNTARRAMTGTLLTAAVRGPFTTAALAAGAPPEAPAAPAAASSGPRTPSALVLTVGRGVNTTNAAPDRAVTVSCAPAASGTHPEAGPACAELARVQGDLAGLTGNPSGVRTRRYDPVVVTASGVWDGRRIACERTFGNDCVKNAHGVAVFTF